MTESLGKHPSRAGDGLSPALVSRLEGLVAEFAPGLAGAWLQLLPPLVDRLLVKARPCLIGIGGGQGSGKSTLARLLSTYLEEGLGLATLVLSLDDFYLGQAERQQLARDVSPLLATRGVPGTHEIRWLSDVVREVKSGGSVPFALPVFDKRADERLSEARRVQGPFQVVLLEGWCVGAAPQPESALLEPCNELERLGDPAGTWRRFVNQQLRGGYAELFGLLDGLLFLKVPDFDAVHRWRYDQELRLATAGGLPKSPEEIAAFCAYFERLTQWMALKTPDHADVVVHLNAAHGVDRFEFRETRAGDCSQPAS